MCFVNMALHVFLPDGWSTGLQRRLAFADRHDVRGGVWTDHNDLRRIFDNDDDDDEDDTHG